MRILFTGGGTLGSVTPLLAIYEELAHHPPREPPPSPPYKGGARGGLEVGLKAFWIGTRGGVERELVTKAALPFFPIFSGKFRRYFDVRTMIAPFATLIGFFESLVLLLWLRPTCVIGAGGYVAVPVIWAARLLRIPCFTLQLDRRVGLANRLIAPFVEKIFVAFEESARWFPQEKVIVTGAPIRKSIVNCQLSIVTGNVPTLLVLGGGTGALRLNAIVMGALPELTKICRVVHVTGKDKFRIQNSEFRIPSRYQHFEFLTDELFDIYCDADLIITRAGMGVLSELAALAKPAIVVPLPDTAQEDNAHELARHNAAVIVAQKECTPETLTALVRALLNNAQQRAMLGNNLHTCIPTTGAKKIAQFIIHNS